MSFGSAGRVAHVRLGEAIAASTLGGAAQKLAGIYGVHDECRYACLARASPAFFWRDFLYSNHASQGSTSNRGRQPSANEGSRISNGLLAISPIV